MNIPSVYPNKSLTYLIEVETLAQDIFTLKETKLELANVQNKLRESLRALQQTEDKRSYIKVGPLFIEYTTPECQAIVQKEIDKVKTQYDLTSADLREKVLKMRDLEHEPLIKGLRLNPLSYNEAQGLAQGFGVM